MYVQGSSFVLLFDGTSLIEIPLQILRSVTVKRTIVTHSWSVVGCRTRTPTYTQTGLTRKSTDIGSGCGVSVGTLFEIQSQWVPT